MNGRGVIERGSGGYSLVELMIVVASIVILVAAGVPLYSHAIKSSKKAAGLAEMKTISLAVELHIKTFGVPPDSLADVGFAQVRDPWGNPYGYLRLDTHDAGKKEKAKKGGVGAARKDHNLVPINADYDLYSMGPDGRSASPLTAEISRDDLIRGQNGDFFGLASDY